MLRVGHVVMKMDDALRPSRRSRRIHPECHVPGACVGTVEIGRQALKKFFGPDLVRCVSPAIHDDDLLHPARRHDVVGKSTAQVSLAENESRLGVGQKICQRLSICLGVQQDRHQPGAHRAEKSGRIGWRIVQKEGNAVPAA